MSKAETFMKEFNYNCDSKESGGFSNPSVVNKLIRTVFDYANEKVLRGLDRPELINDMVQRLFDNPEAMSFDFSGIKSAIENQLKQNEMVVTR